MTKRAIQPIPGPRTLIRSLAEEDLCTTRRWRNRPETRRHFFSADVVTKDAHQEWFRNYLTRDDDYVFIIELLTSGVPIGQTALYAINHRANTAEFGRFMIGDPRHRGSGYGREAMGLTCRIAFEFFGLSAISLEVKANNAAAICVYQSLGFSVRGRTSDVLTMELGEQQWLPHARAFSN